MSQQDRLNARHLALRLEWTRIRDRDAAIGRGARWLAGVLIAAGLVGLLAHLT